MGGSKFASETSVRAAIREKRVIRFAYRGSGAIDAEPHLLGTLKGLKGKALVAWDRGASKWGLFDWMGIGPTTETGETFRRTRDLYNPDDDRMSSIIEAATISEGD